MKLQVALDDITLENAVSLVEKIHDYVDIIEIGTPFVYEYGMHAVRTMKERFPDKEVLADMKITSADDMVKAAEIISSTYGCAVLCKGGHSLNDANDLLYAQGIAQWFNGTRIDNPNTHGTGCTLSSAIASNLAKGYTLSESVDRAKDYISRALASLLDLGSGSGPINHIFDLGGKFAEEAE